MSECSERVTVAATDAIDGEERKGGQGQESRRVFGFVEFACRQSLRTALCSTHMAFAMLPTDHPNGWSETTALSRPGGLRNRVLLDVPHRKH